MDLIVRSIDSVIEYKDLFIQGIITTIYIGVLGTVFGIIFGSLLAAIKSLEVHYKDPLVLKLIKKVLKFIANFYTLIIRGTPMIIQAALFYYSIAVAIGFDNPNLAGLLVVTLNTGAYISEIIIGGIKSLDKGQMEAARSLGLSYSQAFIKVILPQAFKNTLPSLCNMLILNIKDTSVLQIISVTEITYATQSVASVSYDQQSAYLIAAVLYLILTSIFALLFTVLFSEKKMTVDRNKVLQSGAEYE